MRTPRWALVALEIAAPVGAVLLLQWWAVGAESIYFPPPSKVWHHFQEIWLFERVASDLVPSVVRMVAGLVLGVVAGYFLGIVLAVGPRALQRAVDPVIEFLRAIPPPALLPLVVVAFGIDASGKILVIALGSMFPVLLNTTAGAREIDPLLYDVCASYDVRSRRAVIGRVVVPASLPRAFVGLQTSLAVALILMVISEMVASPNGIGRFILESQRTFAIGPMWAGIVLLGALGYLLNAALSAIEHRVLSWHLATHGERR